MVILTKEVKNYSAYPENSSDSRSNHEIKGFMSVGNVKPVLFNVEYEKAGEYIN